MANYLQRVIAAGARLRSTARPPLMGSAIIPSIAAPMVLPVSEEQPHEAETLTQPSILQSPQTVPASTLPGSTPARSTPAASTPVASTEPSIAEEGIVPSSEAPTRQAAAPAIERPTRPGAQPPVPLSVAIARMTSQTLIVVPKALRPQKPMPSYARESSIQVRNVIAAAATQSGHLGASQPEDRRANGDELRRKPDAVAATTASPRPRQMPEHYEPRTTVSVTPAAARESPAPGATRIVTKELTVAREVKTSPGIAINGEPAAKPRPTAQSEGVVVARPVPVPQKADGVLEPHAIGIKPKILASAIVPPVAAPERGHTRQSRITIGKIDVLVDNHRLMQTSGKGGTVVVRRVPPAPTRSDHLATFYLGRFFIRP